MLLTRDLVSVLLRAVLVLNPQPPGPGIPQASGQRGSRQAQGCALPMVLTWQQKHHSILKIELNYWASCLLFFCEDQPPKVCAICCDYSLFLEKAISFVAPVITSDSFATIDYYAVFSILKQIVTLFPWSLALHSVWTTFPLFLETLKNFHAQIRIFIYKQHASHFDSSLTSSPHSLFWKSSFTWADISLVTPVMFFHKSFYK